MSECQDSLSTALSPRPAHLLSLTLETEVEEGIDSDELSSLRTVSLDAIDESLAELSQVAIAIRQSSKTTETVRARNFASGDRDLSHALNSFETLAFLALETLYPNAPDSLLLQLGRSMADRYARLLLREPRHSTLKKDIRRQFPGPSSASDTEYTHAGGQQPAQNVDVAEQIGQLAGRQRRVPPTVALSSVDWSRFQEKLRLLQTAKSRSGTTAILAKTHEPPVPHPDDDGNLRCEWCFTVLPPDLVNDGRWTSLGR